MKSPNNEYVICDERGCNEQIKNHHWGKIKAEGWLFSKDGKAFCPKHLPDWLIEWREKK